MSKNKNKHDSPVIKKMKVFKIKYIEVLLSIDKAEKWNRPLSGTGEVVKITVLDMMVKWFSDNTPNDNRPKTTNILIKNI